MVHESLDSATHFYVFGAVLLVLAFIAGAVGTVVKRRLEEANRDERYVRERRGETVETVELPRYATLLQYVGVVIGGFGIIVLIIGWTVAPGKP
jgi:hypothetical protein